MMWNGKYEEDFECITKVPQMLSNTLQSFNRAEDEQQGSLLTKKVPDEKSVPE